MAVLSNLQPEKVFYYFEKLCSVPHGSGNTKQISDLCVGFAKELGLKYRQEACNNVIIWKNGSCGYENAAPSASLQPLSSLEMPRKRSDRMTPELPRAPRSSADAVTEAA